jgi:hypothetical protein
MKPFLALFLALGMAACTATHGTPVDQEELGYLECDDYFGCGHGRYCTAGGYCFADCRSKGDCTLFGEDMVCNSFGQCLPRGGGEECTRHSECGEGRFCNGLCSGSGALCDGDEDCPVSPLYPDEKCIGTCASNCGAEDDCKDTCEDHRCNADGTRCERRCRFSTDDCETDSDCTRYGDLTCTPIGQCMFPGWERWIPPAQLPPTRCNRDEECMILGFHHFCDCEKEHEPFSGFDLCMGGGYSLCQEDPELIGDFGDGPADRPAHQLTGIWGARMEIAVRTVGLPIVNEHNSYSSSLHMLKFSHHEGDTLQIEHRICEIKIINFNDDDSEYQDMIWMVIPHSYLRSLAVPKQYAEITSATPGSTFETDLLLELRGCRLDDPAHDPLPLAVDYQNNPDDPRFWDQDEDGKVGLTVYVDGVLRGEIYYVQRWTGIYGRSPDDPDHRGIILDQDRICGLTLGTSEEYMVSTNNDLFNQQTMTFIHDHADRTYFRFQRLPDDASCADLIREGNREDSWLRHTDHQLDECMQ